MAQKNINLTINAAPHTLETTPSETLFVALRRLGYFGIKFGDEHGLSGADTVLLDGRPVNAGSMLAIQAEGHKIVTIEALGEHPAQGTRSNRLSSRQGPSSAATAPRHNCWPPKPCWTRIRIRAKPKSGKLSQVCSVVVLATRSQCRLFYRQRR